MTNDPDVIAVTVAGDALWAVLEAAPDRQAVLQAMRAALMQPPLLGPVSVVTAPMGTVTARALRAVLGAERTFVQGDRREGQ